jgi:hypothetical protein
MDPFHTVKSYASGSTLILFSHLRIGFTYGFSTTILYVLLSHLMWASCHCCLLSCDHPYIVWWAVQFTLELRFSHLWIWRVIFLECATVQFDAVNQCFGGTWRLHFRGCRVKHKWTCDRTLCNFLFDPNILLSILFSNTIKSSRDKHY